MVSDLAGNLKAALKECPIEICFMLNLYYTDFYKFLIIMINHYDKSIIIIWYYIQQIKGYPI